jgi:hypothetical protein
MVHKLTGMSKTRSSVADGASMLRRRKSRAAPAEAPVKAG